MQNLTSLACLLALMGLGAAPQAARAQQPQPAPPTQQAPPPAQPAAKPLPLVMRIDAQGFGVDASNIAALLQSAGGELWKFFPDYKIEPIVVSYGAEGPIVLHKRNEKGEVVVLLNTTGTFWSQYSYQFAHEFCHVLSGFKPGNDSNRWFEETLCETASLFAMRAMAHTWRQSPPYSNWRDYRDALSDYSEDVVRSRDKLPQIYARGMGEFYRLNRAQLEKDPCVRELNGTMAVILLNILEKNPEHWEAVRWLNAPGHREGESFTDYLRVWSAGAPERHKPFVKELAAIYGVSLAPPPAIMRRGGR